MGVGRRSASSMRCPPIRFRRPGPAVRPVRCPVTWVRRPGSGVRPSGVHPSGVQPSGVRPVCPDASVWFPSGGGVWGQADAARQPAPRERAPGPVGCRVVERLGSTAEQARTRATPPRSRMVGGDVGGGPGPGCGRPPRLTVASWAGQAGVLSARRRRLREGTEGGRSARLPHRPRGCRLGMSERPRCVVVVAPAARVDGPGGADGLAGGDGRAAPARPGLAASVPGSLPAAL
jgi:hypothetical protein